ncbi:hypothetical protein AUK45_00675 [Candidatus Peregrinibacteria bacterium CG2_30_44_17]|nr:MAG: hypothetical protein AUK45_00675 [Candidatus Peregrinibacteria bacterium CG2_30_44_17]
MEPCETSPLLKPLYAVILIIVAAFLIPMYGLNFDNYPETELVNYSFIWVPCLAFSLVGLATTRKERPLLLALSGAVASFVLLFAFFEILWPLL